MNFRESLKSLLVEVPSFDNAPAEFGNIVYATTLGYNDQKKAICKSFIGYVCSKLQLKSIPKISFVAERVGEMTTGAYDPTDDRIYVLAQQRLLADVLRTLAHELTHAMQRQNGSFKVGQQVQDAGGPIEDEANAKAGELLKTFVRDLNMKSIYSI